MDQPERGTTLSVGAPFEACPAAIVPPAKAVFSSPDAALFDFGLTSKHRSEGQSECCYAWCGKAPPGSGMQGQKH